MTEASSSRRYYPRSAVALVTGAIVLAVSGCAGGAASHGGPTTPSTIVRSDLLRIAHALPRWEATTIPRPPKNGRCITRGGDPAARIARGYDYPFLKDVRRQVFATVEYRAPAKSRALIADFATPRLIKCERAYAVRFYHRWVSRFPPGFRHFHVRMTAGLPGWLRGALGRQAEGYTATVTTPGQRTHGLVFVYQDARDPHVVYQIGVNQIGAVPRGVVLGVIRATG